jgi:hypothetical protein
MGPYTSPHSSALYHRAFSSLFALLLSTPVDRVGVVLDLRLGDVLETNVANVMKYYRFHEIPRGRLTATVRRGGSCKRRAHRRGTMMAAETVGAKKRGPGPSRGRGPSILLYSISLLERCARLFRIGDFSAGTNLPVCASTSLMTSHAERTRLDSRILPDESISCAALRRNRRPDADCA